MYSRALAKCAYFPFFDRDVLRIVLESILVVPCFMVLLGSVFSYHHHTNFSGSVSVHVC